VAIINKSKAIIDIIEINADTLFKITGFELLPIANLDKKILAGDKGTPEGIYFINEEIVVDNYDRPRKTIALVLNYPNASDQYNKQTGSDVWIQEQTSENSENNSCFYLKNHDLDNLKKYLRMNNTPILILQDTISNLRNRQDWLAQLEQWKTTFASKMLLEHSKMYITDSDQLDFEYAKKINEILTADNSNGSIMMNNIIVLQTPGESIVSFRFIFSSTDYNIDKQFSLSLLPVENDWKIFSENSQYRPPLKKSDEEKIRDIIYAWKKAWENKNFNRYINFYSKAYNDNSRNFREFYNYKQRNFRNVKTVKVGIKDLAITRLKDKWQATFIQDYWADNYQDFGKKTIIFEQTQDNFLIIYEDWEEIQAAG
jgi:murein L,D-transpeptidase YafK